MYQNYTQILYRRKDWRVESLANLANRLRFAKLKPSEVVVTINNPLADLFIRQTFSTKCLEGVNSSNILPAKLSHYTVYHTPPYKFKSISATTSKTANSIQLY